MKKSKKIISVIISVLMIISSVAGALNVGAETSDADLMTNATFTANSEYHSSWFADNRPLSKLNDGANYYGIGFNLGNATSLKTNSSDDTAYVNAAFSAATTLNKIVVYLVGTSAEKRTDGTGYIRDFAIDAKLADGSWVRVAEQHLNAWTNWDAKVVTLCFDAVSATDIRFTAKGYGSIYEIDAFYVSDQTSDSNTAIDSSKNYTADAIPMPVYANLMTNATFTANSEYYNGWYPDNRPISKLNDGQTYVGVGYNLGNAAMVPKRSDGTGYINAAFSAATTLNKIVVYLAGYSAGAGNVRNFAIDVKLENGNWVRVAEQHLEDWSAWDAKVITLCFDAVSATDIRITMKETAPIYEIEAFNVYTQTSESNTAIVSKDYTDEAIPMPAYQNLFLGLKSSANPQHEEKSWYFYNRNHTFVNDGKTFVGVGYNAASMFISPREDDGTAYINLYFNEPTTLNKIVVYFPGYNACEIANQVRDYAVDVRDPDGVWIRVAEQHNEERSAWDAFSDTLCFDAVTGIQVRITCVNVSLSLYEVEAYNVNAQTSASNTALEEGDDIPQPLSISWKADEDLPELDEYAYSFALVGDTQKVTYSDVINGTSDLANMYQYIIDKKDEYKIAQVIGLGDIVDTFSDGTLKESEWEVAASAISKLDGVLPYTLIPGNHDSNKSFNYSIANRLPNYLKQSQIISKYGRIEAGETTEEPSVANTAHEFSVNGVDYLIVTIEYAAHSTAGVIDWANKIIQDHPHHNVIVTTHAYLDSNGDILDGSQFGSPSSYDGCESYNNGDYFWDNLISKHENITMVLCGHMDVSYESMVMSTKVGEKGNTVTQIMVNPQAMDASIGSTGMVAFLFFSADGKSVQVRQYSTVKDKYCGTDGNAAFTVSTARAAVEGDVNNDATVNILDLIRYKKHLADANIWIDTYTCDFDKNGSYDVTDLKELRKKLLIV